MLDTALDGRGKGHFRPESLAEIHGEFAEFETQAPLAVDRLGRLAGEQIPHLDDHFPGDRGHCHIAVSFTGEELPAPR